MSCKVKVSYISSAWAPPGYDNWHSFFLFVDPDMDVTTFRKCVRRRYEGPAEGLFSIDVELTVTLNLN